MNINTFAEEEKYAHINIARPKLFEGNFENMSPVDQISYLDTVLGISPPSAFPENTETTIDEKRRRWIREQLITSVGTAVHYEFTNTDDGTWRTEQELGLNLSGIKAIHPLTNYIYVGIKSQPVITPFHDIIDVCGNSQSSSHPINFSGRYLRTGEIYKGKQVWRSENEIGNSGYIYIFYTGDFHPPCEFSWVFGRKDGGSFSITNYKSWGQYRDDSADEWSQPTDGPGPWTYVDEGNVRHYTYDTLVVPVDNNNTDIIGIVKIDPDTLQANYVTGFKKRVLGSLILPIPTNL